MPAIEEHYRSQRTLHIVFATGSIVMLATLAWMILADHLRPWKDVQRRFFEVEQAKLKANEKEKKEEERRQNGKQIADVEAQIKAAGALADKNYSKIKRQQSKLDEILGRFDGADTLAKFQKAEVDSLKSFYDEMIDQNQEAKARDFLLSKIIPAETKLRELTVRKQAIAAEKQAAEAVMADLKGRIDDLKKKRDALLRDSERIAGALKQKEENANGPLAWIRGLPVLDLMAPPAKIRQVSLPDLTINYNFKEVPRYDRCMTCHMAADRVNYETDAEHKPLPKVFAGHPHLADGHVVYDSKTGKEATVGLYLDSNGPHPINYFGCTICHGGQGSGTDFTFASHEPDSLAEAEQWKDEYNWEKIHHWDYPMLSTRFLESGCLKCHSEVTDIPQAKTIQAGYQRITKYGCTGCHTIGGPGLMSPDLTDTPKVGPNLEHIASKDSVAWTVKWIKHPQAFRPDTRMPRFYGVSNNASPHDQPLSNAEIRSITHYLYAKSTPPEGFVEPKTKGDPAKGKELFFNKGCMACHAHKDYAPEKLPASAAPYAKADHGPNLSNVADKFNSPEQGHAWLTNWITAPEKYHPGTLMPNLQIAIEDASDIAAWLLSVKAEWAQSVSVPEAADVEVGEAINKLVRLYKERSGVPLSELDETVAAMKSDDKLLYLGEKTISRMGCFGCHTIKGFEKAKPIGTPLDGWGSKSPAKLDYAHILEYLAGQSIGDDKSRDGTDLYYQEQIGHETRIGFLYQKLHRPRSYDYKKTNEDIKGWDERLRMPQFTWADDPKAVEEIMTFVLGLTGEKIGGRYLPRYNPAKLALARGSRLITRYNCKGCHTFAMPEFTIPAGTKTSDALPQLAANIDASFNGGGMSRNKDYPELYPGVSFDFNTPPVLTEEDGAAITFSAMPTQTFEDELTVQLWAPTVIRGYRFNIGDQLILNKTKIKRSDPDGGGFAWLQAHVQAEKGVDFAAAWNKLPPPLVREGLKVQTPWLTSFLKDPYMIRPATILRMPRFHFASPGDETRDLANYFAAKEHADFPYQEVREREQAYLADREAKHPNYLNSGWSLITKGACVQCHAIGSYKPSGAGGVVNGPDLRQVGERFRSEYLTQWLGNPARLLPYTAMPQNIQPHGPPAPGASASLEGKPYEQVRAIRDTLYNFSRAVEQQLAAGPEKPPAPGAAKPAGGGGGQ